ncbi:alpha/beta hydrolase family protein [Chryseobacterium echinoideorum]|uniref:alpha/beta hydrolase family protein n=1 Tax=Chryseobacterium echinoideorum TaxID=1549648 RepID=UPI0011857F6A|nr:alpha/beta hydrolase [Chryseobacterium echinoideorum]
MRKINLITDQQNHLTAHLFLPEKSNGKFLVINSATGVKQQIYFSFAHFLKDSGFTVMTYDYFGIGMSKPNSIKNCDASMKSWGNSDFKAVTDYVIKEFSNYIKFCLGHSVGALLLGMNKNSDVFKQFVFVGTQNAYVGNLRFRTKIEAYIGFGIIQPLTSFVLGYFPANWFGLGESLPKNCAYDWRTLILNRKSTNKLLEETENHSHRLIQNVLVLYAEDDDWLTEKGVESLLQKTYPNLKPEYRFLKASESDKGQIGHINFFRSYNKKLWNIVLNEIRS